MDMGQRDPFFYEFQQTGGDRSSSVPSRDDRVGRVVNSWVESLTFDQAVLFVYKEPLRCIGWNFTLFEIINTVQVHLDFERIKVVQEHQNFAMILSEAFGGESKSSEVKTQAFDRPDTEAEIQKKLARIRP